MHRALWKGTEVCVKKIFDPVITQELPEDLENEVTMMNYLRHPHTLLLMGSCIEPPNLFLLTEFCPEKSLYEILHVKKQNMEFKDKVRVLKEVAETLLFYHQSGVVHRDLKTHNILIDKNSSVKLCDFGLARFMS